MQQPAPAFVPGGYVSYPAPAKRRPTGLLVALFSALALLTGMVAIAFFNQTNPASISTDYKNEDWEVPPVTTQPPPLVKPEDRAEITTLTKDNPLYNTSLESPVRCDLELLPGREQDDQELGPHSQTGRLHGIPAENHGFPGRRDHRHGMREPEIPQRFLLHP